MDVIARLEALAAAPKPWVATIYMPDGTERIHRQPRRDMAEAHANRMADKYGVRATVSYQPE